MAPPGLHMPSAVPIAPGPHTSQGMHWKGGGAPPPVQGSQPMLSHCPPDGKHQLQWHLVSDSNRTQPLWQPPPTACLTASGAPAVAPSLLMHPCPEPHIPHPSRPLHTRTHTSTHSCLPPSPSPLSPPPTLSAHDVKPPVPSPPPPPHTHTTPLAPFCRTGPSRRSSTGGAS